jgi:hypothetical protein
LKGKYLEESLDQPMKVTWWRLRHNKELYELLAGPDIVNFIKFKRLQWASHIVRMDNSRILKKVLDGKFHGRRPVLRPRLRWEDIIRRDSLLLLNIRGWRRWAGDRDIWRRTTEEVVAPLKKKKQLGCHCYHGT